MGKNRKSPSWKRAILLFVLSIVVLGLGAWAIENRMAVGLWNGERFYRGRPYSSWKSEMMEWQICAALDYDGPVSQMFCPSNSDARLYCFPPQTPWWIGYVDRLLGRKVWEDPPLPLQDGDPKAFPMLEAMLQDGDEKIRAIAASGLSKQPEISESTIRRLQEMQQHDESWNVRVAAAVSLKSRQQTVAKAVVCGSQN